MERKIVLDTETTGLNIKDGHRIISIGAVEIINRVITGKNIHIYINPMRKSDPSAFAIHGISDDFLQKKPKFHEIISEFLNFLQDDPIIIHNAPFDIRFLRHEFEIAKAQWPQREIIDTLVLARKKYPGSPASLDALCRKFEIDNTDRIKHGALIDSELLAKVYLAMTAPKQTELKLNSSIDIDFSELSKNNKEISNKTNNLFLINNNNSLNDNNNSSNNKILSTKNDLMTKKYTNNLNYILKIYIEHIKKNIDNK